MLALRLLTAIFAATMLGGFVGAGVGAILGRWAPDFVRLIVGEARGRGDLDPAELGLGLGIVNGMLWGLLAGVVVVVVAAWRETSRARRGTNGAPHAP
jgi:hypothetical protein